MKRTAIWNWIFAAVLALGTASFTWAGDGGSDDSHGHDGSSATSSSSSGQVQAGDDNGGQAAQPGDDHGNHAEPGDDHGNHVEPGDDKGGNSGNGDDNDFRIRRKLMPAPGGPAIDASGHVVIRAQGNRQRFQVEVEAMVADGTTFMVFADDNLAGTVTLQMGEGELELDTEDGDLPEGLDPVTSIKTVTVKDANGVVILQGQL